MKNWLLNRFLPGLRQKWEEVENIEKPKCKYCENLEEMEREYPDGSYHGADIICDECGANYYEEYSGEIWATNEQARINHPEFKRL
ncbi:MAG: hypothetical protein WC346_06765 [Methanogenium sp.]|jgi:hypothetical protein